MLRFEVELISLQKGVPEGYLFVWLDEIPEEIFEALDINQDKEVPLEEVTRAHTHKFCSIRFCLILDIPIVYHGINISL